MSVDRSERVFGSVPEQMFGVNPVLGKSSVEAAKPLCYKG